MPDRLLPLARSLRSRSTSAERRLWQGLRREQIDGFRFRRQVIVNEFIVDFVCFEARLAIEVDDATHSTAVELARDTASSIVLGREGFTVLRFSNNEVSHNLAGVLEAIRLKLAELRPRIEEPAT
jgi:very-short-patch-repair endonuclease